MDANRIRVDHLNWVSLLFRFNLLAHLRMRLVLLQTIACFQLKYVIFELANFGFFFIFEEPPTQSSTILDAKYSVDPLLNFPECILAQLDTVLEVNQLIPESSVLGPELAFEAGHQRGQVVKAWLVLWVHAEFVFHQNFYYFLPSPK